MKHLRPRTACLFLSLVPIAQADIIVWPDGSVAPVVGLEQAIAIAQPGETLFLMPGDYAGATIAGKSLRILGAGKDLVTIGTLPGSQVSTPLVVEDLDRGQSFLLSGVTVASLNDQVHFMSLRLAGCRGLVTLHDVEVLGFGTDKDSFPAIDTAVAEALLIDGCSVRGNVAPQSSDEEGSVAISLSGGATYLNDSVVEAGMGDQLGQPFARPAFLTFLSDLDVHGGRIQGGSVEVEAASGDAAAGIDFIGGTLRISGPQSSLIRGGDAVGVGAPPVGGGAAFAGASGHLTLFGGVQFEGGSGSDGQQAESFKLTQTKVVRAYEGQHRPGLATLPSVGSPGSSFELQVHGTPGRAQTIFVGSQLVLPFKLGGFDGKAFLDPADALLAHSVVANSEGSASLDVTTPDLPELSGTFLWYQSFEFQEPDGRPLLGLPAGYRFL